jgi:hypothetical protein
MPVIVLMLVAAAVRVVIRLRVEIVAAVFVAAVGSRLAPRVGGWHHLMYLTAGVVLVGLVPPWSRRRIVGKAWCVITRHRIRTALAQAGVVSAEGRIPYILHTRPTPVGTQVTVWMRAGTALEQLGQDESVRMGIMRAACWAREVRMERHPAWSHIVTFHLVRYDTLAPTIHVTSLLPVVLGRIGDVVEAAPGRIAAARERVWAARARVPWPRRPRTGETVPLVEETGQSERVRVP